jgi:hypothetical protein
MVLASARIIAVELIVLIMSAFLLSQDEGFIRIRKRERALASSKPRRKAGLARSMIAAQQRNPTILMEPAAPRGVPLSADDHVNDYVNVARGAPMNGIIYLIGLVVVVLAILSFFGLR